MNNIRHLVFGLLVAFSLSACDHTKSTKQNSANESAGSNRSAEKELPKTAFKKVTWRDLMPSAISTRVVSKLDGQAVQIPGFIVPLEFDDEQTITQFFLVPFFGACIHVPPPPPNQVVFVEYPEGFKAKALHVPFSISGILRTSLVENEIATAGYSLKMQSYELYRK